MKLIATVVKSNFDKAIALTMKKKKTSLKEKIRRQNQNAEKTLYLDGAGDTFTMTKTKDGYKLNV